MKNRNRTTPHEKAANTNFYVGKDASDALDDLKDFYGLNASAAARLVVERYRGYRPDGMLIAKERSRRRGSPRAKRGFTLYPDQLCALDRLAEVCQLNRSQMLSALILDFAEELPQYTPDEVEKLLNRCGSGRA